MSSTESEILNRRLLKLFPVKLLKEEFQVTASTQPELIDTLVYGNTDHTLREFAFDKIDCTKQHVYIYTLNRAFDSGSFSARDFPIEVLRSVRTSNGWVLHCLPKITHNVVLIEPFETRTIDFYQPIKITLDGNRLILQFTILEKNLKAHFERNRCVYSKRMLEESAIKDEILNHFGRNYQVDVCDMNRGVKYLWDNGLLDGKALKFKRAKSTATVTMDEEETYKEVYPEEYRETMKDPLHRTVLKYKVQDDELCDLFTIDPSKGEISFNKYPLTANQIQNVISKILANN
ncbi:hypothetical protein CLV24_11456 [Pontibacter ummariensis]|uniref:Uncharacterized protein n=1 Tax=Pontibacter ummariensis TaxID=1610492 RepID=A0A239HMJ0_9BACT|nr:hypothetical protein [Pontibacter ummariensis]PRY10328.1 hypothetical protein CLV24_11456 [Pontibacter ummariensis]SNS82341.1 hypothetical protein SAMN06296052_11456 [Pontibacter ummariensis]